MLDVFPTQVIVAYAFVSVYIFNYLVCLSLEYFLCIAICGMFIGYFLPALLMLAFLNIHKNFYYKFMSLYQDKITLVENDNNRLIDRRIIFMIISGIYVASKYHFI